MSSKAQRDKMHAMFNARGVTDRGARLRYTSTAVGRIVNSSSDLTMDEANKLIHALEQWDEEAPPEEPPS